MAVSFAVIEMPWNADRVSDQPLPFGSAPNLMPMALFSKLEPTTDNPVPAARRPSPQLLKSESSTRQAVGPQVNKPIWLPAAAPSPANLLERTATVKPLCRFNPICPANVQLSND